MLAWPAKGKLVKLAMACFPRAASRTADMRGRERRQLAPAARPKRRLGAFSSNFSITGV